MGRGPRAMDPGFQPPKQTARARRVPVCTALHPPPPKTLDRRCCFALAARRDNVTLRTSRAARRRRCLPPADRPHQVSETARPISPTRPRPRLKIRIAEQIRRTRDVASPRADLSIHDPSIQSRFRPAGGGDNGNCSGAPWPSRGPDYQ